MATWPTWVSTVQPCILQCCNVRYGVLMPAADTMRAGDAEDPGATLRVLRERSGHSVREVSDALGWSSSKLSRIETSSSRVKLADLERLLDYYGAPDAVRADIGAVAQSLPRRGRGVSEALPSAYDKYTRLEAKASHIALFGLLAVPGLLQTPEYAANILQATPVPEERFLQERLEIRMVRQVILGRLPPLRLDVILDEAALTRPVGGPDVLRRQMIRLKELSDRPETTIRILPFSAGTHPAMSGPFAILDFPGEHGSVPQVFCDGLTGGVLHHRTEVVERYRSCFLALERLALDVAESTEFIAERAGIVTR